MVERSKITFKPCVFYVDLAVRRHGASVSRKSRRKYAVKHINAALYAFEKMIRGAYAHDITRLILRQIISSIVKHFVHELARFANAQAAYGVSRQVELYYLHRALVPQVLIHTALHYSEKRLSFSVFMRFLAAPEPPGSSFQ